MRGGRHTIGALQGGASRGGAEILTGHPTPIEGGENRNGGLVGAEDRQLLPITSVGCVVLQDLLQVT